MTENVCKRIFNFIILYRYLISACELWLILNVACVADATVMDSEGTLGRGHANGGRGLRRQRSLEWRERRGYGASAQSSSDDEDTARHAVGPVSASSVSRGARSPGQVFASILAQQYNSECVTI